MRLAPTLTAIGVLAAACSGEKLTDATSSGASTTGIHAAATTSAGSSTSTTASGTGTTHRATSTSGGSSTEGSAGAGQGSSSTGSTGTTGGTAFTGSVAFGENPDPNCVISEGGQTCPSFSVTASFTAAAASGSDACAGTQSGACCFTPPSAGATGSPPASVSAGPITVTDGSSNIGTLTFSGASGGYSSIVDIFAWSADNTLGVSAPGAAGGVSALTGFVVAPSELAGVTPSVAYPLIVSRVTDFSVTWTQELGLPSGMVSVVLVGHAGPASAPIQHGTISCTVPFASKQLQVPHALLASFDPNDTGTFLITPTATGTATSANAIVTITANGLWEGGVVTYQ